MLYDLQEDEQKGPSLEERWKEGVFSAAHLNVGGYWGPSFFTRNAAEKREEDGREGTGGIGSTYHDDGLLSLLH